MIDITVQRFTTSPMVARLLADTPEWTAITKAIVEANAARSRYTETNLAGRAHADLSASTTAALLRGEPVPDDFPRTAGDAARAAADTQTAWSVMQTVHDNLSGERDHWVRGNTDRYWRPISDSLDAAVTAGRKAAHSLGDADTPDQAARAKNFPAWEALEAAHTQYREARAAHHALLVLVREEALTRSVHRLFANVAELFPEWDREDQLIVDPETRVTHIPRRPWPEPVTSIAHFQWVARSTVAEPWAPTPAEIHGATEDRHLAAHDPIMITRGGGGRPQSAQPNEPAVRALAAPNGSNVHDLNKSRSQR